VVVEHWLLEFHVVVEAALVLQIYWSSFHGRIVEVGVEVLAAPTFAVTVALQTSRETRAIFLKTFCLGALARFSLGIAAFDPHGLSPELLDSFLFGGLLLVDVHLFDVLLTHAAPFEFIDLHGIIRHGLVIHHFLENVQGMTRPLYAHYPASHHKY
jgi:hypothetical protein